MRKPLLYLRPYKQSIECVIFVPCNQHRSKGVLPSHLAGGKDRHLPDIKKTRSPGNEIVSHLNKIILRLILKLGYILLIN